jgi:uncharacterized membrane protein
MRQLRATILALGASALMLGLAAPTGAARGLQLVTPYPAVVVGSGKSVTLNIQVITPTRQRVDLSIPSVPDGWQATLRGGGFVINGVFGAPDTADSKPPDVQLEIRVPPEAGEGDYEVVVRGSSRGSSATLPVSVHVAEKAAGAVTLIADFPTLRGKSDTTFTFRATLQNNTPEKTSFSLSADGPPGWRVEARPQAETKAATVTVDGGGSSSVEVEADPPNNVPAGSYEVKAAAAGGGLNAEASFSIEITGNVSMELTTATQRLNARARAGRGTPVVLVVDNKGTAPLKDVSFTQSAPSGWDVKFTPDRVPEVAPGRSARVQARITPAGDAVAGDYSVTVTATSEGSTSSKDIRVAVQGSRLFGLVGLLVIAGTGYGLYRVFQRYGRR